MKPQEQMALYGVDKQIFKKLNKHQQGIFRNSWRLVKLKNSMNKKKLDKDLKELITIFFDEDFNVIYNERDVLKNTKYVNRAKE